MRTTIEIEDDKLIRLKQLAAERGHRGFSMLVDEALALYLVNHEDAEHDRRRRQAEAIRRASGTISEETANRMMESVRESRSNWRER